MKTFYVCSPFRKEHGSTAPAEFTLVDGSAVTVVNGGFGRMPHEWWFVCDKPMQSEESGIGNEYIVNEETIDGQMVWTVAPTQWFGPRETCFVRNTVGGWIPMIHALEILSGIAQEFAE